MLHARASLALKIETLANDLNTEVPHLAVLIAFAARISDFRLELRLARVRAALQKVM